MGEKPPGGFLPYASAPQFPLGGSAFTQTERIKKILPEASSIILSLTKLAYGPFTLLLL